jgi:hypothetical protein
MDSLIDGAYAEFDEKARNQMLIDIQKIGLQQWTHIPTHHSLLQALVHPSVRGLDLGSAFGPESYIRFAWLAS